MYVSQKKRKLLKHYNMIGLEPNYKDMINRHSNKTTIAQAEQPTA